MATVIDALVVTLGLDPSGFKKGESQITAGQRRIRDDANRTAREIQAMSRQITNAIDTARNAALGLVSVFTIGRGLSSFVSETTASSAALGRMSRDLQISTNVLSAWEGVSRRAGNAAGAVSNAIGNINQQISDSVVRALPLPQVYNALGVRTIANQTTGEARPSEDIYQDFVRALAQQPARLRLGYAQAAGQGQETVNLAGLPPGQLQRFFAAQRSVAVTGEDARAATSRTVAWLDLEDALTATTRTLLTTLTPGIVALLEKFREFASYLGGDTFRPVFDSLRDGIKDFATYLGGDDFQRSMRDLRDNIVAFAAGVVEALRFLGVIPRAETAPNPDGSPAPTGRDRGLSWWTGRTAEEQQRMRLERENRDQRPPSGAPPDGTGPAGRQLSPAEFRERFGVYSRAAAVETGVSEDVILGQMALETDWGRAFAGRNNPFNLTARAGADATEGNDQGRGPNGEWRTIRQRFQNFDTPEAAAAEYAGRMRRLWPNATGTGEDVGAFARGLRPGEQGGYAEAPNYGLTLRDRAARFRRLGPQAPPAPDPALITGPRQGAALSAPGGHGASSSSETSIGNISVTVNTAATDAQGIAQDIGAELRRSLLADQFTRGLA